MGVHEGFHEGLDRDSRLNRYDTWPAKLAITALQRSGHVPACFSCGTIAPLCLQGCRKSLIGGVARILIPPSAVVVGTADESRSWLNEKRF